MSNQDYLKKINNKLGWQLAGQALTVVALGSVNNSLAKYSESISKELNALKDSADLGFKKIEDALSSLEINLINELEEVKWVLGSIDDKLRVLIGLVEYPAATKSEELYQQAIQLYSIDKIDDAIRLLKKSLEQNQLNVNAYIGLALCYQKLNQKVDNSDTKEQIEELIKISKTNYYYHKSESEELKKHTDIYVAKFILSYFLNIENYNKAEEFADGLSAEIQKVEGVDIKIKSIKINLDKDVKEIVSDLIALGKFGTFIKYSTIPNKDILAKVLSSAIDVYSKEILNLDFDKNYFIDLNYPDLNPNCDLSDTLRIMFTALLEEKNFSKLLLSEKNLIDVEKFMNLIAKAYTDYTSKLKEDLENYYNSKEKLKVYVEKPVKFSKEKVNDYFKDDYDELVGEFKEIIEKENEEKVNQLKEFLNNSQNPADFNIDDLQLISVKLRIDNTIRDNELFIKHAAAIFSEAEDFFNNILNDFELTDPDNIVTLSVIISKHKDLIDDKNSKLDILNTFEFLDYFVDDESKIIGLTRSYCEIAENFRNTDVNLLTNNEKFINDLRKGCQKVGIILHCYRKHYNKYKSSLPIEIYSEQFFI